MTERDLFITALQLDPAERPALFDRECRNDPALRQRVEKLLAAHAEAGSAFGPQNGTIDFEVATASQAIDGASTLVGPYKLLEQIGEGGMGIVYMAEQQEPVRRKVALKIIKPGMDSRQVIARFEAERQALAMMEHQNIARVLDAGTTTAGRPYFVMELVKGVPITEYCDKNKLTPRERLELFIPVCRAIQHAHQKGVIHRDIKPSNVLVCMYDGKPVAKVIDFGVAKAIDQRLTERTLFTQHGQVMGTLEYMSPEQAEMSQLDIDTRSDIYSLGVLLYELLTGTTPITKKELLAASFMEMLRMIREKEPERPSDRLSHSHETIPTISAQRRTEPSKLTTLLRDELDWIVMKSLEKDRTRRYDTANGFALDVQRYLDDEPVLACPPSASYRLGKFVRKHRTVIAVAATIAVVLLVSTAVSAWQWREAEAARRMAASQAEAKGKALRQAEALRLTAQSSAVLPTNPGLALLLAIEGAQRTSPRQPEQNVALLSAMNQCRELRTIMAPSVAPIPSLDRCATFTTVCFSHDGRRIASASVRMAGGKGQSLTWDDKVAQVWDAKTGAQLAEFVVPGLTPATIEFSPDDRLVLTTYKGAALVRYTDGGQIIYLDRAVRVWDSATGREVAVLRGHTDRVVTAHFSADGKRIVTASWDKTARDWDAATGAALAVCRGDRFSLASATFGAGGSRVLTVSSGEFCHSSAERPAGSDGKVEFDAALRVGQKVKEVTSVFGDRTSGRDLGAWREYSAARIFDAASGKELHVLGELDSGGLVEGSERGAGTTGFHEEMDKDDPVKPKEETISAAFSPDGRCVATGSWQGAVTIWEAQTGKSLRSWKRTGDGLKKIQAIDYTPDGTRLLMVYTGNKFGPGNTQDEVAVWRASDGKEVLRWSGFSGIRLARFSPNGRRVLIVPGNESRQRQAKWYPGVNGELAFANPEVRTVYLRDVESGEDVALFQGHEENVTSAQFNADGSQVVTAGEDGTVRVWNCDRRQYGTVLPGHASAVAEAAFSPDSRSVMTTCGEPSLRIWNAETGTLLQTLKDGLGLNAAAENHIFGAVRHAEFSQDGSRLLTVSEDSFVLDDAGHPLDKLSTGESVVFAPVRMWDVASGKKLTSLSGFAAGVSTAALSPDGRRIVTLTDNGFKTVKLDAKNQPKEWGGSGGTVVMTVDPAGRRTRYYQDAAVRVWDVESGRQIAALSESECLGACGAAWSPDGKLLFVAGILADNRVHLQIWNAATLKPMQELPTGQSDVSWFSAQPAFSRDSRRLLLLRTDQDGKLVTIWDLEGGKRVELRGHQDRVNEAAFSPDGKWVVTASNDGTARVWNAATGEQVFMVGDEHTAIHSAAFSPDGRWIVTACDDGTACIWSAESGREYFELSGHRGPVFFAAFSPDSQHVVTASGDGTARIWPIDPLPVAISRMPRNMTDREREKFLNGLQPSVPSSRERTSGSGKEAIR